MTVPMTVLDTHPENAFSNDRAHVFHSWSAQGALSPVVLAGAEGSYFWTQDGTRYLDFSSQLVNVNIGHQHPKLVAAIKDQADRLCTVAPFHANDARSEAARLICEVAAEKIDDCDLNMVFFTNGGAEATENAVRMARLHTNRTKVLTHYRSYHGGTNGAIMLTGDPRRWPSEPGMPGVVKFWGPYAYRSAFHSTSEDEEGQRALAHLDDVLMVEGGHTVAAIIVETVVGTNGILVPPDGYLQGVRDRCDRHGIVMICDEVMAGFGRCGEWFAFQKWGVQPDLVCFAKGVNSGYLPLGGVVISQRIADTFRDRVYPGGLDLLGSSAGMRLGGGQHQHLQGGRHHRTCSNAGHRRDRSGSGEVAGQPSEHRRGPRPRRVLGARPRHRPGHPSATRAVQRLGRRRQADGRPGCSLQAAWPVAIHPFQPTAHRAAVHGQHR